jgi:hypothetical protein
MVCQIIHSGIAREQFGTVIEIDANKKRTPFGRRICGNAGQKLSLDLERWNPVGEALFYTGHRKSDLLHSVEGDPASGH